MDETKPSISPCNSHGRIGADATPMTVDNSRPADAGDRVVGCPPNPVLVPVEPLSERSMLVFCDSERELREGFGIALRAMGVAADFLPADVVPSAASSRENN